MLCQPLRVQSTLVKGGSSVVRQPWQREGRVRSVSPGEGMVECGQPTLAKRGLSVVNQPWRREGPVWSSTSGSEQCRLVKMPQVSKIGADITGAPWLACAWPDSTRQCLQQITMEHNQGTVAAITMEHTQGTVAAIRGTMAAFTMQQCRLALQNTPCWVPSPLQSEYYLYTRPLCSGSG